MKVVGLPSSIVYTNLYTLSEFLPGISLIVTNNSIFPCFIIQSATQPPDSSEGYPVVAGQAVFVQANDFPVWIKGGTGPILIQDSKETISPFTTVDLPHDLYTTNVQGERRLRVDPGQTGFFTRRMWRLSYEFTALEATPIVLKITVPTNFIIHHQDLTIDSGGVVLRAYRSDQGTQGGTFGTVVPKYSMNFMDELPEYVFVSSVTTGGTFTPAALPLGAAVETTRVRTAGSSSGRTTVGAGAFSERGLAADSYYLVLARLTDVNSTCQGVYSLIVEERP